LHECVNILGWTILEFFHNFCNFNGKMDLTHIMGSHVLLI
jgi:hypothetical protein